LKKKIFINIKGGLGNQLCQYSFLLYLVKKGFKDIFLYSDFSQDTYDRQFLLDKIIDLPWKVIHSIPNDTVVVRSEDFNSIQNYLNSQKYGNFLLDGYFINFEYITSSNIFDYIEIKSNNSDNVALHIRRSDYGHHGLLPISYYLNAIETNRDSQFVIFTDEPNFCNFNFGKLLNFNGVKSPDLKNPINDFLELCRSKSIVIANSSFSWMAAMTAFNKFGSEIFYPSEWQTFSNMPGHYQEWHKIHTNLILP
jgi:hypothetical protein